MESTDHLRELVFRIYWDGAEKPAVACPLGDFFGLGSRSFESDTAA